MLLLCGKTEILINQVAFLDIFIMKYCILGHGVSLILPCFPKMLYIFSGNSVTPKDCTKRVIFILKCLMTNLFILCGCYFAFSSDLVHINNIQGDSNTCRGALQSRCWCTMGELLTHSYNIINAPLNAASTVQSLEKTFVP